MKNRRQFMKTLMTALPAVSVLSSCMNREKKRPNILFIMSDDHSTKAISCYGSHLTTVFKTPNIDRLAAEGVKLENCFCTNSICAPSRASIHTGQYSHINGVYTLKDAINPAKPNLAKEMQKAGYQTAIFGKWHLKTDPSGFDGWQVLSGQGRYHDPVFRTSGGTEKQYTGHSTDIITNLSLEWLKQRNPDVPFFLQCHFKAPHENWEYAKRFKDTLIDVELPEPESLFEDKSHRSDGSRDYGFTVSETMAERQSRENYHSESALETTGMKPREIRKATYQKFVKMYLRAVMGVDENVGRILDFLDEQNLTDDTLVVYTSDQGYFLGEHNYIDKRWMYEEALRMPFIVRYPNELSVGKENNDIILNIDFAPMMLDYAGVPTPDYMQGRSFRSNLNGKTPEDWRTIMYYRYWLHTTRPAHMGVRTKRYKLIFFYGLPLGMNGADQPPTKTGWELYDLENDPKEMHNVYSDSRYAETVAQLKREMLRLRKELGDTDEGRPEMLELLKQKFD